MLLAAAVGWAVVRSQPSAAWACESASDIACAHRGAIDLGDDDIVVEGVDDVAVDNGGERFVVAVVGQRPSSEQTGAVALVDAASGSVDRWLVRGDRVNRTSNVAFSPDGRLVGVFVVRLVDDEAPGEFEAVGQFEIYEADSGDLISETRLDSWFACNRMGFSADNTEAQCGQLLIDTETGQRTENLLNENRYGIASHTWTSWGIGDVWAEVRGAELKIRTRELGWEVGDPQEVEVIDLNVPSDRDPVWTRIDHLAENVATMHVAPERSWFSTITSRASAHAPSTLTLVGLGAEPDVNTVGIGFEARWAGWSTNGDYLVAIDDAADQFVVVQTP